MNNPKKYLFIILSAFVIAPSLFCMEQVQVSQENCSVCQELCGDENNLKKLICGHLFHEPCIKPWLENSNTCPNCRKQAICFICEEQLKECESIELDCGHVFHKSCGGKWIRFGNTCPICVVKTEHSVNGDEEEGETSDYDSSREEDEEEGETSDYDSSREEDEEEGISAGPTLLFQDVCKDAKIRCEIHSRMICCGVGGFFVGCMGVFLCFACLR